MGTISAFITSTGTECGKTFVTRGLAHALSLRGHNVAALKPIETGCSPDPLDALALAQACGKPALAHTPGFYRARLPLSPHAISLETGAPGPDIESLSQTVRALAHSHDFTLVEGAGGLLTPLDATRTLADLALHLASPVILVAPNRLGVLSHALTAVESAQSRGLRVSMLILSDHAPNLTPTNLQILAARLPFPVLPFPFTPDNDALLAASVEVSGLLSHLGPHPTRWLLRMTYTPLTLILHRMLITPRAQILARAFRSACP